MKKPFNLNFFIWNRLFESVLICDLICLALPAWAQGRVTQERNCNVRIEDEDFEVGETLVFTKLVLGKEKRIAQGKVTRKHPKGGVVARVVAGAQNCRGLMGTAAVAARSSGASKVRAGKGGSRNPKMVATLSLGSYALGTQGVHIETNQNPALSLFAAEFTLQSFPFLFWKWGPWQNALGLELRGLYATVMPDVAIQLPDSEGGGSFGKQKTTVSEMQLSLLGRMGYLTGQLYSEFRFFPLFLHNQNSQITVGDASISPLRNLKFSALGMGFKQGAVFKNRYGIQGFVDIPLLLPKLSTPALSAPAEAANAQGQLGGAGAMAYGLGADVTLLSVLKLGLGYKGSYFKGTLLRDDGQKVSVKVTGGFLYASAAAQL